MKPCRCRNQDCSTRGVHDRLVRRGTRRWLAPHRISLRLGARASRPHPVTAKASSRARACGLSTHQAAGSVRRLAAAELQCDSAGSHLVAPHRISHRLAAPLLRLPLKGEVIGGAPWQGRTANLFVVQPRSWLQPSSAGPGRDLRPAGFGGQDGRRQRKTARVGRCGRRQVTEGKFEGGMPGPRSERGTLAVGQIEPGLGQQILQAIQRPLVNQPVHRFQVFTSDVAEAAV